MPYLARPVADERDALLEYLSQQQHFLRATVVGLSDAAAGTRPLASSLTLGTILKHLTVVQDNWLAAVLAAPGPATRWTDEDAPRRWTDALTWGSGDTLAAALTAYDESCAAVLDALARTDLDTPVPVHRSPWTPTDIPHWSVRWVWFHLLGELARHAGHADLIREEIDGGMSWNLLAELEDDTLAGSDA